MVLGACAAPAGVPAAAPAGGEAAAPAADGGEFTVLNPVLGDVAVRTALAQCIDRDALIASVYPTLDAETKVALQMDSNLPKTHWAWSGPYDFPQYDVEAGSATLDAAGWTLPEGESVRVKDGESLVLKFVTTNAAFRQTWSAVMIQNLAECGIQIIPTYAPASWWFGDTTGLARRDFELGAFAWVGEADPGGRTLYACNQIPLPNNGWEGQNSMGWCNEVASNAIIKANNTLTKEDRAVQYDIFQKEFAKDVVSIPLFQRAEAEAFTTDLTGPQIDPTEYSSWNLAEWKLADGGDTIVIGMSQEPDSMWQLVSSMAATAYVQKPTGLNRPYVQANYDFAPFPGYQDALSTIENGLATNNDVEVKAGDTVYSKDGEPVTLEKDAVVFDKDGNEVTYDGTSPLTMKQLVVDYKFLPVTWSDGTPVSIADFQLAQKIDCDKESGATSFITCESIQDIQWADDGSLAFTVTYLPGVQTPTYFLSPFDHPYPSHQVTTDGRTLADVPAAEWLTLKEIAELPLSFGPYMVKEWNKGQNLVLEKNPYWAGEVATPNVIFVFIPDTNQAQAQLINGDVDLLEKSTLGAQFEPLLPAVESGQLNLEISPSPTWEHMDINLYLP
ncbi:MAG: peptide ABC transporter substrate-binding protein [Anaerolineales bacterium]|nr:peptide ABC transporter substrate-binding protein [Anaerolineales bacterium]